MFKSRKKPKLQQSKPPEGTLIGTYGRREVYIPDDAKGVLVCGTTGSGKTVALSNFIKRAVEKNFPAFIIDGKGDMSDGSLFDVIHKESLCYQLSKPCEIR